MIWGREGGEMGMWRRGEVSSVISPLCIFISTISNGRQERVKKKREDPQKPKIKMSALLCVSFHLKHSDGMESVRRESMAPYES